MKKYLLDLVVADKVRLHESYVLLKLACDGKVLSQIEAGQFVELRVDRSPNTFLRRPISVNFVDMERGELWLLIQTIGEGTRALAQLDKNDVVNVMLPLGKGFSVSGRPADRHLLIGGGVGVAPLLYLGAQLAEYAENKPTFLLGARSKNDLLQLDEFAQYGDVYVTTEDGSAGEKGYVTDHSILRRQSFNQIYTCGPKPMMMSVARYANACNTPCEVSLENTMACGIGACLCCVENTVDGHLCVCQEGPVFNIKQLLWQL